MLRISKLTDYGIVIMAYLANNSQQGHAAKEVAAKTHIALPTVSKLLKAFARSGLLSGQRGAKGGYCLAISAANISLAQIICAIEGDIALTECGGQSQGVCMIEGRCATRSNWRIISEKIKDMLSEISLAQMTSPLQQIHLTTAVPAELKVT